MRNYTKIKISKKASLREESLHPWIFDNEIEEVIGEYKSGDLVDVISYKDKYIGTGFINDNSKIRVRIISRNTNDVFDEDLFLRAHRVLTEKFGEDGYAKFYFKDSKYEQFLKELRELLSDKEKYLKTQKEFIDNLRSKGEF